MELSGVEVGPLVLVGALAFLLAAGAQALSGFGGAMAALPILLLVVSPADAVLASTAAGAAMSGTAAWRARRLVSWSGVRRLSGFALIGMPGGLALGVLFADARRIAIIMCCLVAAVFELVAPAGVPPRWFQRLAGVLAGILLTYTGINGPPLVLATRGLPRLSYRATLQATFFVQDLLAVPALLAVSHTTGAVWVLFGTALVVMPLGWWLGSYAFVRINGRSLRGVVVLGLMATALISLVTTH